MSLAYHLHNRKLDGFFEKLFQVLFGTANALRYFRLRNIFRGSNFHLGLALEIILQKPPALGFGQAGVDALQKQAAKLLSVHLVIPFKQQKFW